MTKKYIVLGLFVIVAASAMIYLGYNYFAPANNTVNNQVNVPPPPIEYPPTPDGVVSPVIPVEKQADHLVEITTSGFWPKELNIKNGDSVIWTNRDTKPHWIIADAQNPYPEKGDCGSKLNSCAGLQLGQGFKLTFTTSGTWKYSDKLNAKFPTGTIIVK